MSDTYRLSAAAPRPIFARVSAHDFENFRTRARAEGLTIDEAFRAIATAYAHGDFYILSRDKSKQRDLNFYLKAHEKEVAPIE
jgi:hypothetical protein